MKELFTRVQAGDGVLKIDQTRDMVDAVLLRFFRVVNLDENDSLWVRFLACYPPNGQ